VPSPEICGNATDEDCDGFAETCVVTPDAGVDASGASCFDGIRNQDELHVDCGGVCSMLTGRCPYCDGYYCGNPTRYPGQSTSSLYYCSGGTFTLSSTCGGLGCQVNAPGVNDACRVADAGSADAGSVALPDAGAAGDTCGPAACVRGTARCADATHSELCNTDLAVCPSWTAPQSCMLGCDSSTGRCITSTPDAGTDASRAVCAPYATAICYDGPAGTAGVGLCHTGLHACLADGSGWGVCGGQRLPAAEVCNNEDDDCNGLIDDGAAVASCPATPNAAPICASGTCIFRCVSGFADCNSIPTDGCEVNTATDLANCGSCGRACATGPAVLTSCTGGICNTPCANGYGDCDHTLTDGCEVDLLTDGWSCGWCGHACPAGTACSSGACMSTCPTGTTYCSDACVDTSTDPMNCGSCGVAAAGSCVVSGARGACAAGALTCRSGTPTCIGTVSPSPEICNNIDDDCDGVVDNGIAPRPCYDGPAGTLGVGVCRGGNQTCSAGTWGACAGETLPTVEVCDGLDNNCNGVVDEGCSCIVGATQQCYSGPTGTSGVGPCHNGAQTCGTMGWGACMGDVVPASPENCNGVDDDCDGNVDERSLYIRLASTTQASCTGGWQIEWWDGSGVMMPPSAPGSALDTVMAGWYACRGTLGFSAYCPSSGVSRDWTPWSGPPAMTAYDAGVETARVEGTEFARTALVCDYFPTCPGDPSWYTTPRIPLDVTLTGACDTSPRMCP
jgi:hypothetical protein